MASKKNVPNVVFPVGTSSKTESICPQVLNRNLVELFLTTNSKEFFVSKKLVAYKKDGFIHLKRSKTCYATNVKYELIKAISKFGLAGRLKIGVDFTHKHQ